MSSSLIDTVTSTVIFGVLALTVGRVQTNINATMYENQNDVVTQTNAVEFARQIEWDFAKIGHHESGQKVLLADSTEIRFKADLNNKLVVNTVQYVIGDTSQCAMTKNRDDFPIFRTQDGKAVKQNWGLTYFKITYYDNAEKKLSTPITSAVDLAKIHSINVAFRLESAEPVVTMQGTTWAAVTWRKTIIPRNLGNLNY